MATDHLLVLFEQVAPAAVAHLGRQMSRVDDVGEEDCGENALGGQARPLGDFFAVGHGLERPVSSIMVRDGSSGRSRNSYWQMPFARRVLEAEDLDRRIEGWVADLRREARIRYNPLSGTAPSTR